MSIPNYEHTELRTFRIKNIPISINQKELNVAYDYVINDWLTEMGVVERPDGLLYDEQFKGQNAEAITTAL